MQNENIGNFAYNLEKTPTIVWVRTVHLQKYCGATQTTPIVLLFYI